VNREIQAKSVVIACGTVQSWVTRRITKHIFLPLASMSSGVINSLSSPGNTRLVTIVAHVDHGKTTLADNLIEHNGIISERLAGSIRYLDSNEEEQRRGITMKSSAIALKHEYEGKCQNAAANVCSSEGNTKIVHLIDSPGHVDFGSEVTSSLLACDGALLVVDVVEGMCARTHAVLRESYANELVPVLVVNKLDRLQSDLGLSPTEAYLRIRFLIESINAAAAAMILTAKSEEERAEANGPDDGMEASKNSRSQKSPKDDECCKETVWNFDPTKGNVVFCSSLHGWGFTVPGLARSLFRGKVLPFKPPILRQALFGDYRYNETTKKIVKWKQNQHADEESGAPLFARFALLPLWNIYEGVALAAAAAKASSSRAGQNCRISAAMPEMKTVITSLQMGSIAMGVDTVPLDAESLQAALTRVGAGSSEESVLRVVLRRYRPLSKAVLDTICELCPSPSEATSSIRTSVLALKSPLANGGDASKLEFPISTFERVAKAVKDCDASLDSPTVAHVCKFVSIRNADIHDLQATKGLSHDMDPNHEQLMALTRVLSGRLEDMNEYYVHSPGYDPFQPTTSTVRRKRIKVYLLMGSSLVRAKTIPAGHICAVAELSDLQWKTITLCDTEGGMPLRGFENVSRPLVKVNVEPVKSSEAEILERGLLRLALGDAAVEVTATAKGERLLACRGELHLEQSILELKKKYCDQPIELRISAPIAEFGESTDWFDDEQDFSSFSNSKQATLRQTTVPPYSDEEGIQNAKLGRCRAILAGQGAAFRLRTLPLRRNVFECVKERQVLPGAEEELELLARALAFIPKDQGFDSESIFKFLSALCSQVQYADNLGNYIIEAVGVIDGSCVIGTISNEVYRSFGEDERNATTCNTDGEEEKSREREVYNRLTDAIKLTASVGNVSTSGLKLEPADKAATQIWRSKMRGSVVGGFQLATRAGPFCEEPVRGVLVVVEGVEIALADSDVSEESYVTAKPMSSGMVVSAIRQGIRCSLLSRPARIVEAHVRLTLHASLAGLGPLYDVMNKRRGKVVSDEMVDGTDLIMITANLPQKESFGLASELLKKTSGEVTAPELVFSHFEVLEEDPFWAPTTEDEVEEFGHVLSNGSAPSTGSTNNALSILREVRKRKGLLVDSARIVVAAEKQRTLARKK
jgi:ribosome assembly protein 1